MCPVDKIVVFDNLNLPHATSRGTIRVQLCAGTIWVQPSVGTIWVPKTLLLRNWLDDVGSNDRNLFVHCNLCVFDDAFFKKYFML